MDKATVDLLIGVLQSVIKIVEAVDPAAASNKVVVDALKAIEVLQGLGL